MTALKQTPPQLIINQAKQAKALERLAKIQAAWMRGKPA